MFQTLYNRSKTRRDSCPLDPDEPSQTRQEFAQESDINFLIARYQETGSYYDPLAFRSGTVRAPMFDDFSELPDFDTAQNFIADSHERFMHLPAKLRARFDNDPALLLAFLNDKNNYEEAVSLGLITDTRKKEVQGTKSPASAESTNSANGAAVGAGA